MNHPQPPTKMQVDNTNAIGFATDTIKQKLTKAIDIRFYWIRDRCGQGQLKIYWKPGYNNTGDYHTKHHPPTHHRAMRPTFLCTREQLVHLLFNVLQGCDNSRKFAYWNAQQHSRYSQSQNVTNPTPYTDVTKNVRMFRGNPRLTGLAFYPYAHKLVTTSFTPDKCRPLRRTTKLELSIKTCK